MDVVTPLSAPELPVPPRDATEAALGTLPVFEPDGAQLESAARAYLAAARRQIQSMHFASASGRTVVRAISEATDRLLSGLFMALREKLAPRAPLALAALGGYGRRELAPCSDLDLLLVHEGPEDAPREVAALAERLLYLLWDLKLEIGWGMRTVRQCVDLAEVDLSARTALLDCRPLAGDADLQAELDRVLLGELFSTHADAFIAGKLEELQKRRQKYGESVFLLEPNLKQGEGGLRDLQAGFWIAHARFGVAGVSDLMRRELMPPREVSELLAARDFLWRVRNQMHYHTGRKEDRLTFDLQVSVAEALGYGSEGEGLPVERFMRHFYVAATAVQRFTDALIARCGERPRPAELPGRRLSDEFREVDGRVAPADANLFARDPSAMVRLFALADRCRLPLHSRARDLVLHERSRMDERVRATPEVVDAVKALMVDPDTRGEFLVTMHELGVLAALLPEFGGATARVVHDVYHVYTVDVHCLFVVRRLYALRNGELAESEPKLSWRMQQVERPLPLLLAALMHDAAKGGGGGHSELGARLMRQIAQRLRLSQADADDAEFLVREHLTMSHLSQRRDLSDPELIRTFAHQVGSLDRLRMLQLLTYADMASVAPGTWNGWRARLLEELYARAHAVLAGEAEAREGARTRAIVEELRTRAPTHAVDAFLEAMPPRYLRMVTPTQAVRAMRLLARGAGRPFAAAVLHRANYTDVMITAADRPGLLALVAGTLAAHRIDILHAEIFSTHTGRALDRFALRAPHGGPVEPERWGAARRDLREALAGRLDVRELLSRRAAAPAVRRPMPQVQTHIAVDNDAASDATVIDVYAEDHIGLLFDICRALFDAGLEIDLAKIATEGHRATDAFYVRRGGRKIEDAREIAMVEAAMRQALG